MIYFLKPLNVLLKYSLPRNPNVRQINHRERPPLNSGRGQRLWSSLPVLSSTDSIHPALQGLRSLFQKLFNMFEQFQRTENSLSLHTVHSFFVWFRPSVAKCSQNLAQVLPLGSIGNRFNLFYMY